MGSPDVRNLLTEILTEQAGGVYTPYTPTMDRLVPKDQTTKEKITGFLGENIFGGGRSGQRQAQNIMDFADFTPLSPLYNAPQAFMDIQEAGGLFNPKAATMPAILLAAELSGTGGLAKGAAKKAKNIYDAAPFSKPEYKGAAPDRSTFTYLRYKPKNLSPRMVSALDAINAPNSKFKAEMIEDIKRGQELGGDSWYNTEELRDWFVNELGEKAGDAHWRHFMSLMGTTSPGSKVDANIGNAAYVRKRLLDNEIVPGTNKTYFEALKDVTKLEDAQILAKTRAEGFGHKTGGAQEMATARYVQGQYTPGTEPGVAPTKSSLVANPKPKGFTQSLIGNQTNIAADLHFTRYMAMASGSPDWLGNSADVGKEFKENLLKQFPEAKKYFTTRKVGEKIQDVFAPKRAVKDGVVPMDAINDQPNVWTDRPNDNEYAAFEEYIRELAEELDMTPSQVQANLWMGAADRTGVDPSSQGTFMELLRTRAAKRADIEGITPAQVLRNFIRNEGSGLLALPIAAGGAYNFYRGMNEENQ